MTELANNTVDASTASPSRVPRWVEVLLIVLVFFIIGGDVPPHVNESHYLCRLKHYWNPSWCSGDLFLESTDTQVVFIWTFGWLTRWLSLAATAWVGRVVVWTFLAWAWQRLSWRVAPRPLVSVLSAALFVSLIYHCHLAGEWVVGGVEGKCFAYGFVLMALTALVDGRWNQLWLCLGAATAFHPLVGGWSGLVCVGIWLLAGRREASLPSMLPGIVGCGLLSAVGVLPALMLTWNEPREIVAEANSIYVFDRLPHHLAILRQPVEEKIERFGGHAVLLVALALLTATMKERNMRRLAAFAWGAVVLAIAGLTIEIALWNRPLLAAGLQKYYWYRLTDFAAPMAVSLHISALAVLGLDRRKFWGTLLLMAAVVFSGWHLANVARKRVKFRWEMPVAAGEAEVNRPFIEFVGVPPADAKSRNYGAWVDVCDWIAENTPPDAVFLTPRLNLSFKWRAGRAEVVNRKDIPQDARGILEWRRRLKEIYEPGDPLAAHSLDSLGGLRVDRVKELAKKYGADYLLADRTQVVPLPRVFSNEEYVVYKFDDADAGGKQPAAAAGSETE